jgi:hypothetical protein
MPYTIPTSDDFFARFPIFEDADDDTITALIAEAASAIDESWREADYQPAILYLTAHLWALDNSQAGEDVTIGGPGNVQSESFAGMSVSFAKQSLTSGVSSTTYGSTEYGRRYYALLLKNKPGIAVA